MLVSLGLDHRRADLAVRERFHLDDTDVTRICGKLTAGGAAETVVVRTCNRLEVYGWWPASDASAGPGDPIREIGRAWAGDDDRAARLLAENARVRTADTAVRHLFRVSSGLESQIVGDIHILGQVRRSLRDAVEVGSIGSHLHRLFETALRVGKQVQRSTHLMSSRRSVGSEAARRAADRVGSLAGRTCIVVGCGKSGTQAARTLQALGATDLVVLNRSRARAEKLARELGSARAGSLDRLPHELGRAGVVIVATGAPEPIVHADDWGDRVPDPSARTLVIDVSVPRNVAVDVGRLPHVELLDLDGLRPQAADDERARREAVEEAEAIVEESVDEYLQWMALRPAHRALRPFHEVLSQICRRELFYMATASDAATATRDASTLADRTADRIVARVMSHPMTALRAASERGEHLAEALGAFSLLFPGPHASALRADHGTRGDGRDRRVLPGARHTSPGWPDPWAE